MIDWQSIKTEYITTNISYRKLAQKYGLNYRSVADKGKNEDWVELRNQFLDKTQSEIIDAISDQQVDRAANLLSAADLLLEKVKLCMQADIKNRMDTQSMKHMSGVLKDIKELYMVKSDADMREQEARIANLRKQADAGRDGKAPTLLVEGLPEEFRT